jgi:hypothetical protein
MAPGERSSAPQGRGIEQEGTEVTEAFSVTISSGSMNCLSIDHPGDEMLIYFLGVP